MNQNDINELQNIYAGQSMMFMNPNVMTMMNPNENETLNNPNENQQNQGENDQSTTNEIEDEMDVESDESMKISIHTKKFYMKVYQQ